MDPESPKLPRTIGQGAEAERREAARRERQALALRENLRKRKTQARAKREVGATPADDEASG